MKIAILGTRGIPNNYGGFEQFAEYLSSGLVALGHEVVVYSTHDHPYQESKWNGVTLIHKLNPERRLGTLGQFFYDLSCILDSRKRRFDIILQLGYTSNSIWGWLLPDHSCIVTNMDGLEWKRSKYGRGVQRFLKLAEKLAVKTSDFLIADSKGIKKYLGETYKKDSQYIAYGTHVFNNPSLDAIAGYNLLPSGYNLLIARMEPENNIETILDGVHASASGRTFLVIGSNDSNTFGKYLTKKFKEDKRIRFAGAIYDINVLNNLRYYSHLYFHGHSVGGTNPSLLEAMASNALICAHQNEFNAAILESDAFYFSTKDEVKKLIDEKAGKDSFSEFIARNLEKVNTLYSWKKIINEYEAFFLKVAKVKKVG